MRNIRTNPLGVRCLCWTGPIAVIILCAIHIACDGERNVTVRCGSIEKTQTDLGVVNLPNFALGALLDLDPATKRANRLITISPQATDVQQTNPTLEATTLLQNTDLTVEAGADVPRAVQVELQNSIKRDSRFELTNHFRKEISDPIGLINRTPTALQRLSSSEGHIILFVSGLVFAEGFSIKLGSAISSSGNVDIIKIAKFKFKVTYACNSELQQTASGGGAVLWRATQVRYDKPTGKVVPHTSVFNLREYDLTLTR